MEDTVISRLQEVGFSLYEARVYRALLQEASQNGNEVAKRAAVPSSKVYAALEKLAAAGFVQSSHRGSSTRWAAIAPEELVERLRRQYNGALDVLGDELPKSQKRAPSEPFLTVSGLVPMRETAIALVCAATTEIYLSCWSVDLDVLREPLEAAHERGVRIFGMLYGDAEQPSGSWLHHHYEGIISERVEGRLLALVVDEAEAVIARVPSKGDPQAVRSRSPVMTLIVKEYLHHDYMLQRAQLHIGFEEWDKWWEADPVLRSEIFGEAMSGSAK